MVWLTSPEQRAYNYAMRMNAERNRFRQSVCTLMIQHVHPGNLGPLPPSPEKLGEKAYQVGLISAKELRINF